MMTLPILDLFRRAAAHALLSAALLTTACVGTPTPLAPSIRGSIGLPHEGMISDAAPLPRKGEGYARLRNNDVNWGNPRMVAAIRAAAESVSRERPGARVIVGDLSARYGGEASGHRSHRTGRDADLLLYALTPDGRPVDSPGFTRFGPDGLADTSTYDEEGEAQPNKSRAREIQKLKRGGRYLRLDVEREWLLIKALVSSPEANVQWLFLARWLEALVIEYARARGEDPELIWYAENVLLQPGDSSAHDDHLHLRIACTPDEAVAGCLGGGPYWPWLPTLPQLAPPPDNELLGAIIGDLLPSAVADAHP
jgi:penicillin-insensitive murein DD-endopeptidase